MRSKSSFKSKTDNKNVLKSPKKMKKSHTIGGVKKNKDKNDELVLVTKSTQKLNSRTNLKKKRKEVKAKIIKKKQQIRNICLARQC